MFINKKKLRLIFIFFLIIFSLFSRFYNIEWGSPYFFHPDERNIASSVSRLSLLDINPNFFAYGSLPIYSFFFINIFLNFFSYCNLQLISCSNSFEQAIITGRLFSASLSIILILLFYLGFKKIIGEKLSALSTILIIFNVGLIQFSHFSTFEMWTNFFALLSFFFALKLHRNFNYKNLILLSLITGILISVKLSNLIFIIPQLLILLTNAVVIYKKNNILSAFKKLSFDLFLSSVVIILIYIISNPFTFLDFNSFKSSIDYESAVATGKLEVFYTGEFHNTVPILYQFQKILPFIINPLLTIIFIPSFFYLLFSGFFKKNFFNKLILVYVIITFLVPSFLFVKWTRYLIPSIPFIIVSSVIFLNFLFNLLITEKNFFYKKFFFTTLVLISLIFSVSFIKTTYINEDTRISASKFLIAKTSPDISILSETYDMGIVAFNENFKKITLFNFYDMDLNTSTSNRDELNLLLSTNDYIILPSQRIISTRLSNETKFPNGFKFYHDLLFNKKYLKIYETPCDIFCKIIYLGDPSFRYEGTASVFDRPVLFVFKKKQ